MDGTALPGRAVAWLLVVLAAASGCLGVVCVTRLGGFFASVITGNLVRSGRAIASVDARLLAAGGRGGGRLRAGRGRGRGRRRPARPRPRYGPSGQGTVGR